MTEFNTQIADTGSGQLKSWQQRVIEEKRELDAKIRKLQDFVWLASVGEDERFRLSRQLAAMNLYSEALAERIAAFK